MYGGFWYHIRHAFDHKDNGLYKIIAINLIAFLVLMVLRVFLTIGGSEATYILGGIAGGLLYVIIYNIAPYFSDKVDGALMLGASAGVYAIVVAAATLRPDTQFQLLLIGAVKIKYIAIFYVLVAFANSAGSNAGGELAHLGGAAMGFIYILQLNKGVDLGKPVQAVGQFFEKLFSQKPNVKVTYRRDGESSRKKTTKSDATTASTSRSTQEEIDRILDKIADKGYDNLSKEEKRKLFDFSNKDA